MIQQWLGLAPEIFVLTASCLLLLIGLFQPRLVFSCALLIPVIAAFLTVYSYQTALPVNPLLAGTIHCGSFRFNFRFIYLSECIVCFYLFAPI